MQNIRIIDKNKTTLFRFGIIPSLIISLIFFAIAPTFAAEAKMNEEIAVSIKTNYASRTTTSLFVLYDITALEYIDDSAQFGADADTVASQSITTTIANTTFDVNSIWGSDPADNVRDNLIQEKTGTRFQVSRAVSANFDGGPSIEILTFKLKVKTTAEYNQYPISVYAVIGPSDVRTQTANPALINVTGDSNVSAPVYTVTAQSSGASEASATAGAPFNVDVTLTAVPTTAEYASAQAYLTYDPTRVAPDLSALENIVSHTNDDGNSPLTVTFGPGDSRQVGDGVSRTIPFNPIAIGEAVFSVENATISPDGQSEDDEEIPATAGDNLTVTISAGAPVIDFDTDYEGLPDGHKLLRYELGAAPAYFYTYNGENMHYVHKDNKHYVTYIVENEVTDATALTPVLTDIAYENDGDLNGGGLRISDAQIAYDVATGHANYAALSGLGIQARLKADINGDGDVTQEDAAAIVHAIHHGGNFPQ
jgi:hypothetical protein